MTRSVLPLFLIIFFTACNGGAAVPSASDRQEKETARSASVPDTSSVPAPPAYTDRNNQIIPGERIGLIRLNMNGDSAVALLGKPDKSDAAMGKAWLVWTSQGTSDHTAETDLFTSRRMGVGREESLVKEIRVTSPFFHTADSISTGTRWELIKKKFPKLHKVSTTPFLKNRRSFYDDPAHGFAVEVDGAGTCVAILVHEKNKSLADIYLPLNP